MAVLNLDLLNSDQTINSDNADDTNTVNLTAVGSHTLTVDGVAQGKTPKTLSLEVGRHKVVFTRGEETIQRTITVTEGDKATLCWDFRSGGPCPR